MVVEDFDDFDDDFGDDAGWNAPSSGGGGGEGKSGSSSDRGGGSSSVAVDGERISLADAAALRAIIFGDRAVSSFNGPWREQGFTFCDHDGLRYGLVQHEGGPCGAVGVMQARVLKQLMLRGLRGDDLANVSGDAREEALVEAIADMLWTAACGGPPGGRGATASPRVVVALPGRGAGEGPSRRGEGYQKPDGLTERLLLYTLTSPGDVEGFVRKHVGVWTDAKGFGVALAVYSAMLSRGLDRLRGDLRSDLGEKPTLIGGHNYANQEMVSLLMYGKANSHVFDGTRSLNDDDDEGKSGGGGGGGGGGRGEDDDDRPGLLRGTPQQGEVGFLTLFEKYEYVEVGPFLKNPKWPIWVVCSER